MFDGLYSLWIYGFVCSSSGIILYILGLIISSVFFGYYGFCKANNEKFLKFFKYKKHNKNNYLYLLLLILLLSLFILNSNFIGEIKIITIFFLLCLNVFIVDKFLNKIMMPVVLFMYTSFLFLNIASVFNFYSFKEGGLHLEPCSTYVKTIDLSVKDLSKIKKGDYCISANYIDGSNPFLGTISKKEAEFIINDMKRIKQDENNAKKEKEKQKDDLIKKITN